MRQVLILFSAFLLASCNIQKEEVDLIIHNGSIHTLDQSSSVVQAIAIKDGRIIELGPERAILNRYKAAEQIDLKSLPMRWCLLDPARLAPYHRPKNDSARR